MDKPTQHSVNIIQGEGGGCFAAGTKISTPNGSVDIENIKIGDEVLSFDDTGKISTNKVTKTFIHDHNEIYSFKFWGGELLLNKIHWILNGRNTFFQASHFDPEECVVDESGEFRPFKSLEFLEIGTVYNFWVENDHTYIANGVRVHNGGGGGGKGAAVGRDPYEAPEGIVYDDLEGVRYVSASTIQILDLIGEGPIEGLVRGEHKYEGKLGKVGYDKAFFYRNRSRIQGGMAGITREMEELCEYGIFDVKQDLNLTEFTLRLDGSAEYYIYIKSAEGPTPAISSMGSKGLGSVMWISSEKKQKTFPFIASSIVYGVEANGEPRQSWVVGPKLSDSNGGADHIGGNWRTYETAEGGKNHSLTYSAGGNEPDLGAGWHRSYKFGKGEKTDVDLPLFHAGGLGEACYITSLELEAKTNFTQGGKTVSWLPMQTQRDYSDSCVRIKTQPTSSNDFCMVIHVSSKEGLVQGKVPDQDGTLRDVDWSKVKFVVKGPRKRIICNTRNTITVSQPEFEIITTDGFEYLRSIKWNQTPVLDSTGLLNFQQVRLLFANGDPNGSATNQMGELTDDLQRTRAIGERLVGPTQELKDDGSATGNTQGTLEDFTKVYRVNNKHCSSLTVNVRMSALSQLVKKEGTVPGHPSHHAAGTIDLSFSPEAVGDDPDRAIYSQPEETHSNTSTKSTDVSVEAGDLVRTSVEYIIQWKPVFSTPGLQIPWPGLYDQGKFYGNSANSTISPSSEIGQIHEIVYGKVSYGYNKSTRINLLAQEKMVNRSDFLGWEVRIVRLTPEPITSSIQNSTFIDSLTEHYRSNLSYPNAAIISQEFDAEYFSNIPERSFDVELLKVKVPSNYNPRLRTYGQNRGGMKQIRRVDDTPTYNAEFLKENYSEWLKYKGFAYDSDLSGGLFPFEGGDPSVNGTSEIWDGTFKEVAVYQPGGEGPISGEGIKAGPIDHDENGPQKAGVNFLQYTNNPAWCFYDLMTNRRYGLGKHIDENLLDKWSIYEIGQYCDQLVSDGRGGLEPRFTCNLQINQREDAFKVINDMASIFRGMTYYHAGVIHTVQDRPQQPIFQFNNTNVIGGEFNYQSTSKKVRRNVAVIRYNDPFDNYKPAVEYVENLTDIKKFGIRELEISAFGCTSRAQANRLGNWALISESLETETVGFTAGLEASYLRPGDMVQVFDYHRRHRAHGGRTQRVEFLGDYPAYTGCNVILDRPITGLDKEGLYRFSLLTPSYFIDPQTVNDDEVSNEAGSSNDLVNPDPLRGKHFRATALQDLYFQGKQVTNKDSLSEHIRSHQLTGVTTIKFSYVTPRGGAKIVNTGTNGRITWPSKHIATRNTYHTDHPNSVYGRHYPRHIGTTGQYPVTGFNIFEGFSGVNNVVHMPLVWSIEKSGYKKFEEKNYDYYKVLKIEEKNNQYAVTALEQHTGKYMLAESGLSFDRETYGVTPSQPGGLDLVRYNEDSSNWGGPEGSVKYYIWLNDDTATVGYNLYVKAKEPFTNNDLDSDNKPHPKYLYSRHTNEENLSEQGVAGYYVPTSVGGPHNYYFRAYSVNAAGDESTEFSSNNISVSSRRYISDVIVTNLSMLGETTQIPESEDKSYGSHAQNNPYYPGKELTLSKMAIATGMQVTSDPRFTWQAGFKNMAMGAKSSAGAHTYRVTVRTPSDDSPQAALFNNNSNHQTWSRDSVGDVARRMDSDQSIYEPAPSIVYEVMLPANGGGAFPTFRYFKNLNVNGSKQMFVPEDNDGQEILDKNSNLVPKNTNHPLDGGKDGGSPYRFYDVVVEAIDEDGNSSATIPDANGAVYQPGGDGNIYSSAGARKDVRYNNPYGFDVFFVGNPQMPSLNIQEDIDGGVDGVEINLATRELSFDLNRSILEGDAAGLFCYAAFQPFEANTVRLSNCNKDGFLTSYYSDRDGGIGREGVDWSHPNHASTIYNAAANLYTSTNGQFKIHRSHYDLAQGSFGDIRVTFNLGTLFENEVGAVAPLYVCFAMYDIMDRANMVQYFEDNGGINDENQIQAENRITKLLNLSVRSSSDSNVTSAITKIMGSVEHMEAYISVTTQEGRGLYYGSDDSLKNIKWTNRNIASYTVRAKFLDPVQLIGTAGDLEDNVISQYEHTIVFKDSEVKFNDVQDYRVIASKNVTSFTKHLTKLVFVTPHNSHQDMKMPITVEIFRDMTRI